MSKIKIQGNASGTGVVTLTAPNTNTDRTITLPDGDISLGVGIDDNATSTAITIDASENVGIGTTTPATLCQIGSTGITTSTATESAFAVHKEVSGGAAVHYLFNSAQSTTGVTSETSELYLGWRDGASGIAIAPRIVAGKEGDYKSVAAADSYLAFKTSSNNTLTEKMRITSAGIVTMPNQPAFEVNITGSHPNGQFTPTWGASWEVGSNVSTANKRFTAPVAGTYHFDAWIGYVGAWTSDRVIIYLNVNGSGRVSHQNYRSGQDTGTNLSTNFQLSAGDYVGISLYQDSGGTREIQSSVQWAGFGGYLIG